MHPLLQRIRSLSDSGELDRALEVASKALEEPDQRLQFDVLRARGHVLARAGRTFDAIDDWSTVIDRDLARPADYFVRGELRLEARDYRGAVSDLSTVIRKERVLAHRYCTSAAYTVRAWAHLGLEDYRRAAADAKRMEDGSWFVFGAPRSKRELLERISKRTGAPADSP